MKMVVVLAAASLALAACSKDGDSKNNNNVGTVPETIAPHTLVNKPALTETQKDQFRAFTAQMKTMPDATLAITPANESSEDRQKREEKKNNLDSRARQTLSWIQGDCEIPTPQVSTSGNLNNPGSTQTSNTVSSIGGNKCPVNYRESSGTKVTLVSSNAESLKQEYQNSHDPNIFDRLDQTITATGNTSSLLTVIASDLQNQSGIYQQESKSDFTTTIQSKNHVQNSYTKGSGKMTALMKNGTQVVANIQFEMLQKETYVEGYFEVNIQFAGADATLQVMIGRDGKYQFFVNGQSMTETEMKDIFGADYNFGKQ